ncbi:MAG TPA: LacI family transcriptional regulator [Microbacterium sp.]|nr:LacI family transcriptional regulator [Microbacterium sp.]
MSGIAEVAGLAGVSKATASRALTGHGYVAPETRERVRRAAHELGYVASSSAASLVTGRTNTIALVVPRVSRWYFGEIIEGIERSLMRLGYDLTLYIAEPHSRDRDLLYRHFLARKRFDGVIAVALEPDDADLERLIGFAKPTVCIGNNLPGLATLGIDNIAIGRMITQHLLALGHERIAFVGATPKGDPPTRDVEDRQAGYLQAMQAADLAPAIHPSALTITEGYAAATLVLAETGARPTAIVGACDEIAIGAIIAAQRLGIAVPSQLSTIGVDGHDYAEMFALTTVEQDPALQGENAVAMLMTMMDGEAGPTRTTARARLVMRASTAAPPRSDAS